MPETLIRTEAVARHSEACCAEREGYRVVYVPPMKTRSTENRKTVQSGLTQQAAFDLAAELDRSIAGFGTYGAASHEVRRTKQARRRREVNEPFEDMHPCEGG